MFKLSTFQTRREQLMQQMGADSIGLLVAAPEIIRNGDSHYRYRQDSNFYYMTGLQEPESIAVFMPGRTEGEFVLFVRPRDPAQELWTGTRLGVEGACQTLGADQAFLMTEFPNKLAEWLLHRHRVFYPLFRESPLDAHLKQAMEHVRRAVRRGALGPSQFFDVCKLLDEMRLVKDAEEIAVLQRSMDISAAAQSEAMKACSPGMMEYEIEALLCHHFIRQGSQSVAYTPIVGGGANACVLHYNDNRQVLRDGDLLLVDAGGEFCNYASDITRTYPVNGKFTPPQRAIYELVLRVQQGCIDIIKPGLPWNHLHEKACALITEGLIELGILEGDAQVLLDRGDYKRFYPHLIGHWIGLDVHDVGSYKDEQGEWRLLEPGMLFTVEPGIYIPPQSPGVDPQWWNIGVRIEDDVLVIPEGCRVMTHKVPKTILEIEALMRI